MVEETDDLVMISIDFSGFPMRQRGIIGLILTVDEKAHYIQHMGGTPEDIQSLTQQFVGYMAALGVFEYELNDAYAEVVKLYEKARQERGMDEKEVETGLPSGAYL